MEMVNRLLADSLDGRRFVDALHRLDTPAPRTTAGAVAVPRFDGENRAARRARERAEHKQALRLKRAAAR